LSSQSITKQINDSLSTPDTAKIEQEKVDTGFETACRPGIHEHWDAEKAVNGSGRAMTVTLALFVLASSASNAWTA
jgi:hypothetical protein